MNSDRYDSDTNGITASYILTVLLNILSPPIKLPVLLVILIANPPNSPLGALPVYIVTYCAAGEFSLV